MKRLCYNTMSYTGLKHLSNVGKSHLLLSHPTTSSNFDSCKLLL